MSWKKRAGPIETIRFTGRAINHAIEGHNQDGWGNDRLPMSPIDKIGFVAKNLRAGGLP